MHTTEANALPYLNANPDTITMSGHSAGCFMSQQMSIIHSETIKGVGLFTCWPYGTKDDFKNSVTPLDMVAASTAAIEKAEADGKIEPTANIASQAVYIWSGAKDTITPPEG